MHGKFSVSSKRSIRYVPWSVWHDIETLFPKAIAHRRSRIAFGEVEEADEDSGCAICELDAQTASTKKENLVLLLSSIEKTLRRDCLNHSAFLMKEVNSDTQQRYRVIHGDDRQAWNKFILKARRDILKGGCVDEKTRDLLLPLEKWDRDALLSLELGLTESPSANCIEFLSSVVRPIACKHKLPIRSALFKPGAPKGRSTPPLLNSDLLLLDETKYRSLVSDWMALCSELLGEPHSKTIEIVDNDDAGKTTNNTNWFHPMFLSNTAANDHSVSHAYFAVESESLAMRFDFESNICADPACNEAFAEWTKAEQVAKSRVDFAGVNSSHLALGAAESDPIPIDCDVSTKTCRRTFVKVFEAETGASLESILSGLNMCSGVAGCGHEESAILRRSTRRRKVRFPQGGIVAEDCVGIELTSNIAALRLLLLERCCNGSPFELSHTVRLVMPNNVDKTERLTDDKSSLPLSDDAPETSANGNCSSRVIDLTLDMAGEVLEDVVSRSTGGGDPDLPLQLSDLVIVRQTNEDPGLKDTPKDALLDHLIGLSNALKVDNGKGKRKGSRRVERGFSGTLLGSNKAHDEESTRAQRKICTKSHDVKGASMEIDKSARDEIDKETCASDNSTKLQTIPRERGNESSRKGPMGTSGRVLSLVDNLKRSPDVASSHEAFCYNVAMWAVENGDSRNESRMLMEAEGKYKEILAAAFDRSVEPMECDTDRESETSSEMTVSASPDTQRRLVDLSSHVRREPGSKPANPSGNTPTDRSDRLMTIVRQMMENPDIDKSHESLCYDAAMWAVTTEPIGDNIVQNAYAKYVDLLENAV